jgi:hemin uptake protein HemP
MPMTGCHTPKDDPMHDRTETIQGTSPPATTSEALLAGGREILIHHAGQTYRLLLTASNKLILVK